MSRSLPYVGLISGYIIFLFLSFFSVFTIRSVFGSCSPRGKGLNFIEPVGGVVRSLWQGGLSFYIALQHRLAYAYGSRVQRSIHTFTALGQHFDLKYPKLVDPSNTSLHHAAGNFWHRVGFLLASWPIEATRFSETLPYLWISRP